MAISFLYTQLACFTPNDSIVQHIEMLLTNKRFHSAGKKEYINDCKCPNSHIIAHIVPYTLWNCYLNNINEQNVNNLHKYMMLMSASTQIVFSPKSIYNVHIYCCVFVPLKILCNEHVYIVCLI